MRLFFWRRNEDEATACLRELRTLLPDIRAAHKAAAAANMANAATERETVKELTRRSFINAEIERVGLAAVMADRDNVLANAKALVGALYKD